MVDQVVVEQEAGPHPGGTGSGDTGGATDTNSPANGFGNDGGSNPGGSAQNYGASGGGGAGAVGTGGALPTGGGHGGAGLQIPSTFRNPLSATSLGFPGPGSTKYWVAGGGGGGVYTGQDPADGTPGKGGGSGGPYAGAGDAVPNFYL